MSSSVMHLASEVIESVVPWPDNEEFLTEHMILKSTETKKIAIKSN